MTLLATSIPNVATPTVVVSAAEVIKGIETTGHTIGWASREAATAVPIVLYVLETIL